MRSFPRPRFNTRSCPFLSFFQLHMRCPFNPFPPRPWVDFRRVNTAPLVPVAKPLMLSHLLLLPLSQSKCDFVFSSPLVFLLINFAFLLQFTLFFSVAPPIPVYLTSFRSPHRNLSLPRIPPLLCGFPSDLLPSLSFPHPLPYCLYLINAFLGRYFLSPSSPTPLLPFVPFAPVVLFFDRHPTSPSWYRFPSVCAPSPSILQPSSPFQNLSILPSSPNAVLFSFHPAIYRSILCFPFVGAHASLH